MLYRDLLFVGASLLLPLTLVDAFSTPVGSSKISNLQIQQQKIQNYDPFNLSAEDEANSNAMLSTSLNSNNVKAQSLVIGALATMTATAVACPSAANAATAFTNNAVPSALGAYGHYLSIVGLMACTVVERLTIKEGMSEEEENLITIADIGLGIFGVLITYTGYLRATQLEKGWDFYSHEPVFWLKMAFMAVYGASTLFNTTIIIQRSVTRQTGGTVPPMTEALATRMKKLCNAGIVALALIPATATFMARGVGYNADIPWPIEAAVVSLLFVGLGFKYVKEALDFDQSPIATSSSSSD